MDCSVELNGETGSYRELALMVILSRRGWIYGSEPNVNTNVLLSFRLHSGELPKVVILKMSPHYWLKRDIGASYLNSTLP